MDTVFTLIAIGLGILCGLPYLFLCLKTKNSPNIITFFGIVLSISGVIAASRLGYVTVYYGVTDPNAFGIFKGGDIAVVIIGTLSMMWVSVQGAWYAYSPIIERWKSN